jgi:hypothetical protein
MGKACNIPNLRLTDARFSTAILDATNAQLCQMVDSHFDLVYSMTNNRSERPPPPPAASARRLGAASATIVIFGITV